MSSLAGAATLAAAATLALLAPAKPASADGRLRTCGVVPAYVSKAVKVRQKNTSCRRARQIAYRSQFVCGGKERCRLVGFLCDIENVDSTAYMLRSDYECTSRGARVAFSVVVPF